jgi:Phage gp6-like head-tail connector protein
MAYGDLTTLADVKSWLQTGQSAFPPTDDALLTRLITAASQYIQTWLSRQIAQSDYVEVRDGTGGQRLQFACFPVSAVLSLTIDGLTIPPAPPPSPSTGFTAGYLFSQTQLAVRGYYFTRGTQNVAVTYTAGYPTTPPEIAQACIEMVALRYRERTRIGEVSRSAGGGETVAYAQKDMSLPIATLLQQYRVVAPIARCAAMTAPTSTEPATLVAAL